MSVLLVQSCSESKRQGTGPTPALELYTGYFYKIINKSIREGCFRDDILIRIISAEHGILQPDAPVESYDRRMTPERADELNSEVLAALSETVNEEDVDHVLVNVGADYRPALNGIESLTNEIPVTFLSGSGIGEKGQKLKSLVRVDEQSRVAI